MAIIVEIYCRVCKKKQNVTCRSYAYAPDICDECKVKEKNQEEVAHFAKLDAMAIEDRVREIEIWMYEHSNQKHYRPEMRF